MTVNLAIGYITPPVGVSLYITGAMTKRDVGYVSRVTLPFVIIQIIVFSSSLTGKGWLSGLPRIFGYHE